ncbi:MAG TPA: hypothetical protein PLV68_02405, partial [Ilumatobacteraceae bacterium]|nr:hypothetical protein [Ilumatobacteraceae bacterium]
MFAVNRLGTAIKCRASVARLKASHDQTWLRQANWSSPLVAMQPTGTLEQQVDRGNVGHEEVRIDVEGLLGNLGCDNDEPGGAHATLGRTELVKNCLSVVRAVSRCEAAVEQHRLPRKAISQHSIHRLCSRDRVANDQDDTAGFRLT